ncbi:MAG: hypothetical protein IJN29_00025 [Akkermansia sp.]|nr:hypothetical protein [Akkermansia sp.]
MNNSVDKNKAAAAANFVTGLLTGWGVPAAWAKAVSGAIIGAAIGALVAVGVLTSCTTTYSQTAEGAVHYSRTINLPNNLIPGK